MSEDEVKKCDSCGAEMYLAQKVSFRVGGTPGEWKLLFGELAELGEKMLPLNFYVCPKCGRINLFADEKTKQFLLRLTPKAFLKRCVKCGNEIPIASEECPHCGATQPEYEEL